jgi:hypothetical protein
MPKPIKIDRTKISQNNNIRNLVETEIGVEDNTNTKSSLIEQFNPS